MKPEIRSILPVNEKNCAYSLWNCDADKRRAFFRFSVTKDETGREIEVGPKFNTMVRWYLRKIGETVLRYREYEELYGVDAGKFFKLHWLFPDAESVNEYEDLDSTHKEELIDGLKKLLGNIEGKEIDAGSTEAVR